MKKIILVPLLFIVANVFSQSYYFPASYYGDSVALAKNIPALAKQVIAAYKEPDRDTYYDYLFRLQMAAKLYAEANSSIDSVREFVKAAEPASYKIIGVQFETFNAAQLLMLKNNMFFNDAYNQVFNNQFNTFSDENKTKAEGYFSSDPQEIKGRVTTLLQKLAGSDSIGFADAKYLCRNYNSYTVYNSVLPLAKQFFIAFENKNFIIGDSVLIKTKDGATIAATVVRKRGTDTKQPAILIFNIYNSSYDKTYAKEIADNGYVGIVANTRGKYLSPEAIEPFEHDAADAYDIINWISNQPWSNKKVGMMGGSYLGFSQWAATKKLHPALKTIIPQVAVGIGIDYPSHNGVFMSYMLQWIHYVTNSKQTDQADFSNEKLWNNAFSGWYASGKAFNSLDTIEGRPNNIFQRWLKHPGYDAFWQNMVPYKNEFANINIPVLTTTGYYDDDQRGAMYYLGQHHLYNKNANHYLLIGPYNHGGAQGIPTSVLGGYTLDSVANISITDLAYQWFNYILKDSARPAILQDKINYQVMGTNQWKHAPSLAKMNNDTLNFYLTNTRVAQHYKLQSTPSNSTEFIRQEIDFKDRSDSTKLFVDDPLIIDSTVNLNNALSFVSAPFSKAIEINGSFTGSLMASINKKDMDVTIDMYEVLPDGKYFTLGHTLFRSSYATNRSQRKLLQPNVTSIVPINNTYFTSKKINTGSRLLVVLGINKSNQWQINYGTGKDVSTETIADAKEPLQIKWYGGSVIKVPVFSSSPGLPF